MQTVNYIKKILALQHKKKHKLPTDLTLCNGNILLRSFHILEFHENKKAIKGITYQEAYSHPREGREPEYCYLKLSEIKGVYCTDVELEHSLEEKVYV